MKRRLSAVLLALGLTVSTLSMGVYAAESKTAETEQAATEAVTEKVTEAQSEAAAEDLEELESEVQELETEAETELSEEETLKNGMTQVLTEFSAYTDEQIEQMAASDNASTALVAANWKAAKEEVGNFVEVVSVERTQSEDGSIMTLTTVAKYDKVPNNDVIVTYEADQKTQSLTINWEVKYSFGQTMQRAGLNTIMGVGIVFITLLFLSWLIGRMHLIPELLSKKEKEEAPKVAPAAAPAAAPEAEEEELVDDLELVAVITAAIAASENTSSDGFVVRSIKKANRRNRARA